MMSKSGDLTQKTDLYSQIRTILENARKNAYRAVNFAMVCSYWQIGKVIVEDELQHKRAEYGKSVIKELSVLLTRDYGKGFDERELRKICQFYREFPIRDSLRPELSWTHYRLLLKVEKQEARIWYMNEAAEQTWSTRQLDRQIASLYYERLAQSVDKVSVVKEAQDKISAVAPEEFIHDPYVLEFLNLKNYPALRETDLEQALIDNLQNFLLELGKGFCFVARQRRMRYEDEDFYVDLVFYHSILKCHILIDLKIGKLTHGDIGQMNSYIRMFDAIYKNQDDNPTIGIILCSQKNEAIVKYSVLNEAKQVFASKYMLTLPTEAELQKRMEQERVLIESRINKIEEIR